MSTNAIDPLDPEALSAQERRVVALRAAHLTRDQIAAQLDRSQRTIDGHLQSAKWKAGLPTLPDLARAALAAGVVDLGERTLPLVRSDDRTVISAQTGEGLDKARHVELGASLSRYGAHEVIGYWDGVEERSWSASGVPDYLAVALAAAFEQHAVIANGACWHLTKSAPAGLIWVDEIVAIKARASGSRHDCTVEPDGTAWRADFGDSYRVRLPNPPLVN